MQAPIVKTRAQPKGSSATDSLSSDVTEMLHHSQQAFYEHAFGPVPQENSLFVEQARKPVKR
ncbi:hypothetical protein QUA00_33715 [Microcoleus sp. T2B6]|uniref:hypothetical protein n=1 Tax=Microcoleus sp. T2B6 TaxID=3055424 RepID=UPI002FD5383D